MATGPSREATDAAAAAIPGPRRPVDPPDQAGVGPRVRQAEERNTHGVTAFESGRYDDAERWFNTAAALLRAAVGADDPDTLVVTGNLAVTQLSVGDRKRGRAGLRLLTSNLADRARLLGDQHPSTLAARNALAAAHRMTGDADVAVTLAKRVVAERSAALGPYDVDTFSSRLQLVLCLDATGEVHSARLALIALLNDAETHLGPDHQHVHRLIAAATAQGFLDTDDGA